VRGIGSGFIISENGYILTNAHVVNNATKVTVTLTDRREFEAKVVGMDERSDIAVIKINAKGNLPLVGIGNSDMLRPGQWVLAIGSPFGFQNTVTAGIISATARALNSGYVPFIQTDVAVNPGNSGGPLFNLQGQVVGINSEIYSQTGAYEGISFAIPINVAVQCRRPTDQDRPRGARAHRRDDSTGHGSDRRKPRSALSARRRGRLGWSRPVRPRKRAYSRWISS